MFDELKALKHPQPVSKRQHTRKEWHRKFIQSPKCHYCDAPLTMANAHRDHKTPTCRGGADTIDNIVPSCQRCNLMKAWRTEEEFRKVRLLLSSKSRATRAKGKPKPFPCLEERIDEPGLLRKVTSEREQVSWAWRHPA